VFFVVWLFFVPTLKGVLPIWGHLLSCARGGRGFDSLLCKG